MSVDPADREHALELEVERLNARLQEVEAELQASRLLFDLLPVGVSVLGHDGQALRANPALEQMLGISSEGLRRGEHRAWQYLRPDGAPMPPGECASARVAAGEAVVRHVETGIVKEDGAVIWADVSAAACPCGDWSQVVVVADVSGWVQAMQREAALRASEARYRELFETSRDGIAITDLQGHFIDMNRAFLDLLGCVRAQELCQRQITRITPPEYQAMEAQIIREQVLERGYSDEYEKEYLRANGERVPVSVRIWLRKAADGSAVGVWGVARDISERKAAEKKIQSQLVEKELLLREVHHRIKNNMFSISTLLSLQANSQTDLSVRQALLEATTGCAAHQRFQIRLPARLAGAVHDPGMRPPRGGWTGGQRGG